PPSTRSAASSATSCRKRRAKPAKPRPARSAPRRCAGRRRQTLRETSAKLRKAVESDSNLREGWGGMGDDWAAWLCGGLSGGEGGAERASGPDLEGSRLVAVRCHPEA